jgi:hypothetical protein
LPDALFAAAGWSWYGAVSAALAVIGQPLPGQPPTIAALLAYGRQWLAANLSTVDSQQAREEVTNTSGAFDEIEREAEALVRAGEATLTQWAGLTRRWSQALARAIELRLTTTAYESPGTDVELAPAIGTDAAREALWQAVFATGGILVRRPPQTVWQSLRNGRWLRSWRVRGAREALGGCLSSTWRGNRFGGWVLLRTYQDRAGRRGFLLTDPDSGEQVQLPLEQVTGYADTAGMRIDQRHLAGGLVPRSGWCRRRPPTWSPTNRGG